MKYRRNINRKKCSDLRCIIILLVIFSVIVAVISLKSKGIWGSKTDWVNQHFSIPEYFRTRFYQTGDLFPCFAPHLGGGQNIYNFAYYGLLNPIYLPAYLMPQVTMADYIQAVSLISIPISAIMFYFLMKRHFIGKLPLVLSIMFMCASPLIFHSHRHIMFVSYMPFLILAMLTIGNEDSIKNRFLLIFSVCSILCSSFYFSISAFSSLILYMIYTELKKSPHMKRRSLIPQVTGKTVCIFAGILVSGILWVPTFFTLLQGREGCTTFVNILKLLIPTVNLHYLLYQPYSLGMGAIAIVSLLAILKSGDRSGKFLAKLFTVLICFPIIVYLCNGTMYLDSKVLIPFLPLLVILCGEFFILLFAQKVNVPLTALALGVLIVCELLFNYDGVAISLLLIADSAAVITLLFIFISNNKRNAVLMPVTLFSIVSCIIVNFTDTYVSTESMESIYSAEIRELVDKTIASDSSFYRFANDSAKDATVNRIYGSDYYTANAYSSINNSYYRNFRFETSLSENSFRNNAIQTQPNNEIFNTLMGCRYRISDNTEAMLGEIRVDNSGGFYLFRNDNVLPVGYSSSDIISEECFGKLDFAARTEALLNSIVIPQTTDNTFVSSKTEKLGSSYTVSGDITNISKINGAYEIKSETPFTVKAALAEPVSGKLILLKFRADNRIGKKSERDDISVTINGVKNTLSDPEWKYNNKNYEFTYVLSSDKPVKELVFEFSEGNYLISDFEAYTLDEAALSEARSVKDEFVIDSETMGGDSFSGSINVSSDGWFNISIPYDKGFEIFVDGVKTEYFCTNTAFIGFPVKKGEHFITIKYRSPGMTAGLLVTIGGCLTSAYVLLEAHSFHRRRAVYRKRVTV